MIPVRDVIPTRTVPGVTLVLLAALAAACAAPEVRDWWLPWAAHAVVAWLTGGTLEDRLGHDRFAAFAGFCATAACGASAAAGPGVDPVWAAAGMTAGMITGYTAMFPRSRILTLVPGVIGIEVADVPAWVVFGLWALLQTTAAWSEAAAPADVTPAVLSLAAGALAGALGSVLLRRPERMRVEWWDPPVRPR
jgi:membrane associated rhomboid family serine protease